MINVQNQHNDGFVFAVKNWFSNIFNGDEKDRDEDKDEYDDILLHDLWFMMIIASFSGEF